MANRAKGRACDDLQRRLGRRCQGETETGREGKEGVEKVIEMDLSDEEKKQFSLSIKAVQDLYKVAQNIDKSL